MTSAFDYDEEDEVAVPSPSPALKSTQKPNKPARAMDVDVDVQEDKQTKKGSKELDSEVLSLYRFVQRCVPMSLLMQRC